MKQNIQKNKDQNTDNRLRFITESIVDYKCTETQMIACPILSKAIQRTLGKNDVFQPQLQIATWKTSACATNFPYISIRQTFKLFHEWEGENGSNQFNLTYRIRFSINRGKASKRLQKSFRHTHVLAQSRYQQLVNSSILVTYISGSTVLTIFVTTGSLNNCHFHSSSHMD